MKLVNGFDLMAYAKKYHYVLPAFNTTNLEMTYAIAAGLMDAGLPGYIQISSNNLRALSRRSPGMRSAVQRFPSASIWITENRLKM